MSEYEGKTIMQDFRADLNSHSKSHRWVVLVRLRTRTARSSHAKLIENYKFNACLNFQAVNASQQVLQHYSHRLFHICHAKITHYNKTLIYRYGT